MSDDLRDSMPRSLFKKRIEKLGIKTNKEIPEPVERESRFVRSLKMTIAQLKYTFRRN